MKYDRKFKVSLKIEIKIKIKIKITPGNNTVEVKW